MIIFSSYQLPVLDAGGRYLLFIIYYGRWLDIIEKTLGKTLSLTHRIYTEDSYNFLRQENSFFGAWKSWTIYTLTNTTAKNGSRLTVVEADDGAEYFLRARNGFLSEKHCWQTGYLS